MNIDDIKEPYSYHWSRTISGVTKTGRGPVVQKYHVKGRGWYVIVDDIKAGPLTFRPVHIVRRARASAV